MFKLAVFNSHHLNSNREDFFAFTFFFEIKLQERLINIQQAHISKSYLKFWHVPELGHSVHRGINPSSKAPFSLFLANPPANCLRPLFRQFPIYIIFVYHPHPPHPHTHTHTLPLTFFIFNPILSFKSN